jgi:hypothetical protein
MAKLRFIHQNTAHWQTREAVIRQLGALYYFFKKTGGWIFLYKFTTELSS